MVYQTRGACNADLVQRNVLVHHAPQGVDDGAVGHGGRGVGVAVHLRTGAGKVEHSRAIAAVYCHRKLQRRAAISAGATWAGVRSVLPQPSVSLLLSGYWLPPSSSVVQYGLRLREVLHHPDNVLRHRGKDPL